MAVKETPRRNPQELACWWCNTIFTPEVYIDRDRDVYCSETCQKHEKVFRIFSQSWKWRKE